MIRNVEVLVAPTAMILLVLVKVSLEFNVIAKMVKLLYGDVAEMDKMSMFARITSHLDVMFPAINRYASKKMEGKQLLQSGQHAQDITLKILEIVVLMEDHTVHVSFKIPLI